VFEIIWPLLALLRWSVHLKNHYSIFFEDNESAKYGLFKGMSRHHDINACLAFFWGGVGLLHSVPWFERVASCDNPADALTKPGLATDHLRNAIDDSDFDWHSAFSVIAIAFERGTLPCWAEVESLFNAHYQ